jgi:hypothetical protein
MQYGFWRRTGSLAVMTAGVAVLVLSATSFAGTPAPGAGCGSGATIVGSNTAGKLTIGTRSTTCVLNFTPAFNHAPACMAMNETNGGAHAVAAGVKTTTTTLILDSAAPWAAGDIIAYSCSSY